MSLEWDAARQSERDNQWVCLESRSAAVILRLVYIRDNNLGKITSFFERIIHGH